MKILHKIMAILMAVARLLGIISETTRKDSQSDDGDSDDGATAGENN